MGWTGPQVAPRESPPGTLTVENRAVMGKPPHRAGLAIGAHGDYFTVPQTPTLRARLPVKGADNRIEHLRAGAGPRTNGHHKSMNKVRAGGGATNCLKWSFTLVRNRSVNPRKSLVPPAPIPD